MVELRERRIFIDGKPVLVFAGEIHYYRLARADWADRVSKLKALGCNAVASYIPWLIHESREGDFDLTGRLRPENDLGAFIDLCHSEGLWFIARPGPFIMAEMKNEGLPYWVYQRHPECVPVTWDGERGRSKTVNVLDPGFLDAARKWYDQVIPVIASRQQTKGGPVIGIQLDNEIGMLSWVNNQPELNESILCDYAAFVQGRYSSDELKARYPFDLNDPATRAKALRNPQPSYAAAFLADYGDLERNRIARYVAALRGFAEAKGLTDVPFIVNIHGTGNGKGATFPIGIHQLFESYTQAPGYLSGSDHYFGELTRENAPDLYMINAFMEAVHRPEQPLTSMEFEVGTSDYGETGGARQSGNSADFKVRLSLAQGNRLLNYYLLAGGTNPPLRDAVGDGNDRVAFTGQRHGFAAPISPEGVLDPTYHALKKTTQAMLAVADRLADMDEERDAISLAFLPDYYKTSYHQPGLMREITSGLEYARGPLEVLCRSLLFAGARFSAVDIEHRDPDPKHLVCLSSAAYLDAHVQTRLVKHLNAGGRLFVFGHFPTMDMEGRPCTILADALGVKPQKAMEANGDFHLSLRSEGWASFEPETRVWRAQTFADRSTGVFLRMVGTNAPVGIEIDLGPGRAILLPANYPGHMRLFDAILDRLRAIPAVRCDAPFYGVFSTTIRNRSGERFLNVINLDHELKEVNFTERGVNLLDGPVSLAPRQAKLLPLNLKSGALTLAYATTELTEVAPDLFRFAGERKGERAFIYADRCPIIEGGEVNQAEGGWRVVSTGGPFSIRK